jgi:hypothetical protein
MSSAEWESALVCSQLIARQSSTLENKIGLESKRLGQARTENLKILGEVLEARRQRGGLVFVASCSKLAPLYFLAFNLPVCSVVRHHLQTRGEADLRKAAAGEECGGGC